MANTSARNIQHLKEDGVPETPLLDWCSPRGRGRRVCRGSGVGVMMMFVQRLDCIPHVSCRVVLKLREMDCSCLEVKGNGEEGELESDI
ncbi:hypothetical protein glysoja_026443 [Glycine soja]|uniref:Uncharacterized protein n=1 Tax=Glycine soja TaxID=3848 RepID=A0A0B2STE2_GLYSO|nr:hypothetical protein glysoja_026443 [Glycine soja]